MFNVHIFMYIFVTQTLAINYATAGEQDSVGLSGQVRQNLINS